MRDMRVLLVCFLLVLASQPCSAQAVPDGALPEDGPRDWQEDLRLMLKNSHAEPARPDTFEKLKQLKRRGSIRKVTRAQRYALFSFAGGIIGFRMAGGPEEPGGGDILVGIHASGDEPPPLPFPLERSVGGIALMARKSLVVPREPLNTEDERYFGEKCIAYQYGAGHWITRYFVRNDKIIAISIALEP
jgi:hypothetical protein